MIPEAAIISAIERLRPCYLDRHLPREVKSAQFATIAKSLVRARARVKWRAPDVDFYAMMVSVADSESKLCTHIHAGNCLPGTCGGGAAFGIFQVEPKNRDDGPALVGLDQDATDRSAFAAASVLSRSWQCGRKPADLFTGFAGRKCGTKWATLEKRVATFERVRANMLRAAKGAAQS
jgi:hypothetical protein